MPFRSLLVAAALLLLSGCGGMTDRAEAMIEKDDLEGAQHVLVAHLHENRSDHQARLLLGRVYLLRRKPADAASTFAELPESGSFHTRIAETYAEAIGELRQTGDDALMVDYWNRVVRFNPDRTAEVCQKLLAVAAERRSKGKPFLRFVEGAAKTQACKDPTLVKLETWFHAAEQPLHDLIVLGRTIKNIEPQRARDLGVAFRALAKKKRNDDRPLAIQALREAVELDPTLTDDLETVVLRSELFPVSLGSMGDPETRRSFLDLYDGSPYEATFRVLRAIGSALDAYAHWNRRYPVAATLDELQAALVPEYTRELPLTDGWGTPIQYAVHANRYVARLISAGSDQRFDPSSASFTYTGEIAEYAGVDFIWENGSMIQIPDRSKDHPIPVSGAPF